MERKLILKYILIFIISYIAHWIAAVVVLILTSSLGLVIGILSVPVGFVAYLIVTCTLVFIVRNTFFENKKAKYLILVIVLGALNSLGFLFRAWNDILFDSETGVIQVTTTSGFSNN
ncbi:hypothetical protein HN803_06705 [candidate division WWE3 bacterium]|jgi:hypothetical protein|nr:hypothetical protein [candidate division WWE3 bacterium]MBT7350445.1 hypothetical protein [candidate division WWE3 bacterium]